MTSIADLRAWFEQGKENKSRYMIIVCDTFSYEDYPVFCKDKHEMETKRSFYTDRDMTRVMEVYDLLVSFEEQSKIGTRAWVV